MSTAGTVITRARRTILAGWREQVNRLGTPIDASTPALVFDFALRGINAGSVVELDEELVYVWEVGTANTATVERGWLGTTPAAHDAVIAYVNPRFTRVDFLDAMNAELADICALNNGCFRMRDVTVQVVNWWQGINLPVTDLIRVQDVWQRYTSMEWYPIHSWDVTREMATTEFPSGIMLRVKDPIYLNGPVRVSYRAPYGPVPGVTTNLQDETVGLPLHMETAVVQGMQIRLMSNREIKRNFNEAQGEPRRQEEVPPGATTNSMSALVLSHDRAVRAEAMRLHSVYPTLLRSQ